MPRILPCCFNPAPASVQADVVLLSISPLATFSSPGNLICIIFFAANRFSLAAIQKKHMHESTVWTLPALNEVAYCTADCGNTVKKDFRRHSDMTLHKPKTVSLVLGAGGARGFAHIGVIRWLNENGYSIRSISGASMGALIGGIYAAGQLDAYTDWVLRMERKELIRLLDPAFDRTGLFRGERLIDVLRHMVGDQEIEKLPLRYTAVAMDLDSGDEIWLQKGKLFDAIRASIAIPLVLTPFKYEQKKLVDGGLVNPVPIAPTLEDANDLTVVVSLSGFANRLSPATPDAPRKRINSPGIASLLDSLHLSYDDSMPSPGIIDIALRSMEAMQNTIGRLNMAAYHPDIKIEIPRTACRMHEFWRADELIMLGHQYAADAFASPPAKAAGESTVQV